MQKGVKCHFFCDFVQKYCPIPKKILIYICGHVKFNHYTL